MHTILYYQILICARPMQNAEESTGSIPDNASIIWSHDFVWTNSLIIKWPLCQAICLGVWNNRMQRCNSRYFISGHLYPNIFSPSTNLISSVKGKILTQKDIFTLHWSLQPISFSFLIFSRMSVSLSEPTIITENGSAIAATAEVDGPPLLSGENRSNGVKTTHAETIPDATVPLTPPSPLQQPPPGEFQEKFLTNFSWWLPSDHRMHCALSYYLPSCY